MGISAGIPFYYQLFSWHTFLLFFSKPKKQALNWNRHGCPGTHARNRRIDNSGCFLSFGELLICSYHLSCSPKQQQCVCWPLFLQLKMLLSVNIYSAIKSTCNLKKAVSVDKCNFIVWKWGYPCDFLCLFSLND